jgi:exosortase A-associated hydrolase 2
MTHINIQELSEFVEINGERIYTVLHIPEDTDVERGVVFVHPFAEEKLWSHRVHVKFARELAKQGYYVARFDMRGHGDSDGDFKDSKLEHHTGDIGAIINYLKNNHHINEVGLFGLRLGGTLALLYASQNGGIKNLILWDPVLNGERYMQEILRSNLATQMAIKGKVETTRDDLIAQMKNGTPINIEGYLLTYDYYMQLSELNVLEMNFNKDISCLINQIVRNPKQPENKVYLKLLEKFNEKSILVKSQEEQFWKEIKAFYNSAENLSSSTLNWMESL